MNDKAIRVPENGSKIRFQDGDLLVPDIPIIPFIEGDGVGRDILLATRYVLDAAVNKAYKGERKLAWMAVAAGDRDLDEYDSWLPGETIDAFREFLVGMSGPLMSSGNRGTVLKEALDLYVCQRPVRYFEGMPSPVRHPEYVDMVVFRENTEDIYAGIGWEYGTADNERFLTMLNESFRDEYSKIRFPNTAGIGIKAVSKEGTTRLVSAAITWALENNRRNVTLVHKGNIQKFTEGAFMKWGYEVAEEIFGDQVYTWQQWGRTKDIEGEAAANAEQDRALSEGKLLIKDVIADIVFQQTITRAREFDVLATMNMNGDYLADALAAQVGGINIAPGGNINYQTGHAIFEATHGAAPAQADKDTANPSSMILSGEMMLRYMDWNGAADLVIQGMERAIAAKTVTSDLYRIMDGAEKMKCSEFGDAVIAQMEE